jgi:oligopeptide/dipeptide ABC transporter ATP-binding protein
MPSTPATAEAATAAPLLAVRDLSVRFASARHAPAAVADVTLALGPGECLGVLGESGAGKSQLFLALLGLLGARAHISGSAHFAGTELVGASPQTLAQLRGARIGMVFQDPASALTPHLSVGAQLIETLVTHGTHSRSAARSRALELLRRVRLSDPERRLAQYPAELSGGMRQRLMIALALSCEPQLLIADEPTSALDVTLQAQILALLGQLRRESGMALVLITHDLAAVAALAERVVVMRAGRIIERATVRELLRQPRDPYTQQLVREAQLGNGSAAPPVSVPSGAALLRTEALSVRFALRRRWLAARRELPALSDVSLTLHAGEALGIVGESGCGKSTLARAALALLPPSSGRVLWLGSEPRTRAPRALRAQRRELQLIFQDPLGSLDPRRSVAELVGEPLAVHERALAVNERAARVAVALDQVALPLQLLERYPHQLSGGQCQRVGIARAMILKPAVLVCDEPVSALDVSTQAQIVRLLADLARDHATTLMFISHNLALVRRLCARVLVLYLGRTMELAPAAQLFAHPHHPYTRELLAALPRPDADIQPTQLAQLYGGEPPSPLAPPSGCVFRTRCPYSAEICARALPALERAADGWVACHRWRELP